MVNGYIVGPNVDLSDADLSGADLSGADLSGADLTGADLTGADLSGADLSGAFLDNADLSNADLTGADLSGAGLYDAFLSGAELTQANLTGAYLSGANLSGANLYNAIGVEGLSQEQLASTVSKEVTIASGNIYPEATIQVTANSGKYFVDGVQAPELELISGKEYSFDLSDSSLSSHPLAFKIDGQSWDEAVTVTGTLGVDQVVKITVPSASQGVLSYYCTNHSGMGNDAKIVSNNIVGTNDGSTLVGLSGDDVIKAGTGDDILEGGAGNDTLDGGAGDDTLDGGSGDDTYYFTYQGLDTISDISGSDTLIIETVGAAGDHRFRKLYQDNGKLILEGSRDNISSKLTMSGVEKTTWQAADDSFSDYTMTLGVSGETSDVTNRIYVGSLQSDTLVTGQGGYVEANGADGDDTITVLGGSSWASGDSGNDTLFGGEGNDTLIGDYKSGDAGNDILKGNGGDDRLEGNAGDNILEGGVGNDTIILESNGTFGSELYAYNTTSSLQTGTEESINLDGKTRFGDVMDGGADVDTVELTDSSDAFFLHDSFGGFHSSLTLVEDYDSRLGAARIANIENITSGAGDDIVDLTSPDYSLAGQSITVDGGVWQ